ncbi:DegT/DnrJ/EryC1/StrS family aminotransferase [Mariniblastus fucicola]|uniref:UDP-4-amino-4-deoxy-L-arabinose--oxoglutarate aminotransferase n=1 Tax=Mariniblastus fucicola TaxID=980251 RepID=A0A5B9PA24_9BACT|nr:DegT/DnrJ/EryC1/StrS aminotransferase family protein [Mariniblastus fucicola]QEG22329.1 UDP-4-amino-4-deoxy-L-arabinose--oxoglutarate aminotransferase [Mariniblastus fucicola]
MSTEQTTRNIPFFKAIIGEEEIQSVVETLNSGWLTSGPKVKQFETEFANFVGAKHAIAVNSATAALHLALEAHGIGRGDKVLVPTLTFAATAEVVIHLGATPVLVDINPATFNICAEDIRAKICADTKAIMPVHYAGQPCNMDVIQDIAREHDIPVIEDAAHAFPAQWKGNMIGSIGQVTCFSFYANKTITTGEGGMITTENDELAARMKQMSLHGLSRDAWNRFSAKGSWRYEIQAPGYKYNMPDVAAAIGLGQLHQADKFHSGRKSAALRYIEAFKDFDFIETLTIEKHASHAWHLMVIKLNLIKLNIDRSDFIVELNEAGVGTSVHYTPLHLHPLYQNEYGYSPADLPVASRVFEQIISLPLYPSMSTDEIDYVVATVKRIANDNAK